MSEFKRYRRKATTLMRPWREDDNMEGVTVNEADKKVGSPKKGDMIAQHSSNPKVFWLVNGDYFKAQFEPAE